MKWFSNQLAVTLFNLLSRKYKSFYRRTMLYWVLWLHWFIFLYYQCIKQLCGKMCRLTTETQLSNSHQNNTANWQLPGEHSEAFRRQKFFLKLVETKDRAKWTMNERWLCVYWMCECGEISEMLFSLQSAKWRKWKVKVQDKMHVQESETKRLQQDRGHLFFLFWYNSIYGHQPLYTRYYCLIGTGSPSTGQG